MGGNLWFFGATADAALAAADAGCRAAAAKTPGVIMPFPGGIAASGSKAGSSTSSRSPARTTSTARRCAKNSASDRELPAGVGSVHGDHHQRPRSADDRRGHASRHRGRVDTPGLLKISAGNYGGRLGKSFIYLHPEKQPAL